MTKKDQKTFGFVLIGALALWYFMRKPQQVSTDYQRKALLEFGMGYSDYQKWAEDISRFTDSEVNIVYQVIIKYKLDLQSIPQNLFQQYKAIGEKYNIFT